MTNRELILKAMPLYNLTNEQWDAVNRLLDSETDSVLKSALKTLFTNQARIETITIINDFNNDVLDNNVYETQSIQFII